MKPLSVLVLCLILVSVILPVSATLSYFTGYDIPGVKWYANITLPGIEIGSLEDFYLNNLTGNVYQKNTTGWHWKMNVSGVTGAAGAAATADANWTFTLPAGDQANVTNVGTTTDALFDFFVPVGATGATGATGAPGAPGVMNQTINQTANMTAGAAGPDNDAWYLWVNGTRPMAGNLSMGGYNISNVLDPVAIQDAVTLHYFGENIINSTYALAASLNNYFLNDTSKALFGNSLRRSVNNDYLDIQGGNASANASARLTLYGGDNVAQSGGLIMSVGNASGGSPEVVFSSLGRTDTPTLDLNANRIISLADPTNAQDAVTKNFLGTYVGNNSINASYGDHGALTGLADAADHPYAYLIDTSRALSGKSIFRSVDNDELLIYGGGVGAGKSAVLEFFGADYAAPFSGRIYFSVPNAAKNGWVVAYYISGATDTPIIYMQNHQVSEVKDPVSAQDAATRNYVLNPDYPASAQANAVCYNSATKAVTYNSGLTTCLASSENVKTDIMYFGNDYLPSLKLLKPAYYTSLIDGQHHYGLIAEDVNKIYPELVGRNENGEITGIHYEEFTAVLLKGLQEQQVTINQQQGQIDNLTERMVALEKKVGI